MNALRNSFHIQSAFEDLIQCTAIFSLSEVIVLVKALFERILISISYFNIFAIISSIFPIIKPGNASISSIKSLRYPKKKNVLTRNSKLSNSLNYS